MKTDKELYSLGYNLGFAKTAGFLGSMAGGAVGTMGTLAALYYFLTKTKMGQGLAGRGLGGALRNPQLLSSLTRGIIGQPPGQPPQQPPAGGTTNPSTAMNSMSRLGQTRKPVMSGA